MAKSGYNFALTTFLSCSTALFSISSWANNGDQQIAFSARANAMSGAVIATSQDATAGLTNPAGLASLDLGKHNIRFDLNLNLLNPVSTLNGVQSENDLFILAVGAFAFESELLPDTAIAVGAYALAGGGVDYPVGTFSKFPGTDGPVVAVRQSLRIGPSFARKITDNLAVGVTVHVTVGQFGVQAPAIKVPTDFALGWVWGAGATYDLTPKIRLGAAYTAETRNEDFEFTTGKENNFPGCAPCPLTPQKFALDFQDPQSAAVGISYEPTPKWQFEFDVKWINFSAVRDLLVLEDQLSTDVIELNLGWDDQWVYASGVKYQPSDRLELMLGYNYGKSPIGVEDVGNNPGIAAIIEHHATVGMAYRVTKHSIINLSYNHGFKNELHGFRTGTIEPVNVSFETNIFTLQFTYKEQN